MRIMISLLVLNITLAFSINAQISPEKVKLHVIRFSPGNSNGYLTHLGDTSIILIDRFGFHEDKSTPFKVDVSDIKSIKVLKRGVRVEYILLGSLLGAIGGYASGYIIPLDEESLLDRPFLSNMLSSMGAVVGGVIGAFQNKLLIKIPIEGKKDLYRNQKHELKPFLLHY